LTALSPTEWNLLPPSRVSDAAVDVGAGTALAEKVMADRRALGIIGYILGGVTGLVMMIGASVVGTTLTAPATIVSAAGAMPAMPVRADAH
jgi:hypothetical protein